MAESENLVQKLAKIRAMCEVAQRDMRGYNYSYADITKILAKVTAGMKKYGVSLIPCIDKESASVEKVTYVNTKTDKTGRQYDATSTEMLFKADMTYKWINDENPREYIEVPWFVTGSQPDPAQAMGTGLTYTMRQFLTSYFQIAQGDLDIDKYRSLQKEAEEAESKAVAAEIISEFDSILKRFLVDNPSEKDSVKAFIGRYAKNANYMTIKDPEIAARLLNDFKDQFGQKIVLVPVK